MSRLIRLLSPLIFFGMLMLLNGCKDEETSPSSNNDGTGGSGNVDDAYAELENKMFVMANSTINGPGDLDQISFVRANSLYKGAVAGAHNNAAANFGAGFTEIMMIYADPNINAMIKRWDSVSLGKSPAASFLKFGIPSGTKDMAVPTQALAKNMAKIVQVAVVNPPLIGEMQNLMRDNLLPHIDYALARFTVVEADPNFEFKISGKMQGDVQLDSLMLDNTEVYIMDGVLRGIKAMVEQFLVYRFDLPEYTKAAVVQALQPSNPFFTLALVSASDIGGTARSQSVMADITSMIGKFKSSINYLKSETDDQTNDIIKIGLGGMTAANLDTAVVYLDKALTYLTTAQTVTLTDADIDGYDYTIQVNIANLYNNPPQNPKTAWFPAYTVDTSASGSILWHWTNQTYASFTFPDPTFSGLFPGMTNTDLKRILHIDEAFSWRVDMSIYDYYEALPTPVSAQLVINQTTYNPKKIVSYGSYETDLTFYVMDHDNQSVQLVVNLGGSPVSLDVSGPIQVDIGNSFNIYADMRRAPQNITGTGYQTYTYLYFQNYPNGYYDIERDTTGIPFSVIGTAYSYEYYDYGVTRGKTYNYRARLAPNMYYGSSYVYAYRLNNYTNTVTVTIP